MKAEVWGCMGKTQCDRLQRLQNRAGRIIPFSDYNTRSADILLDLGWDTLWQRRSKQLGISLYKSLNSLYPMGLKHMFKPTSEIHLHDVRGSSHNIYISWPRTEAAKRAFSYRGAAKSQLLQVCPDAVKEVRRTWSSCDKFINIFFFLFL